MDNVSLSFSQEEVVLILKILGAESIPGVGQQPFGEIAEDTQRHLLASAERTLRARGLIGVADERIKIDQVVVALVGTCAVPQYSWLVTRAVPRRLPENRFYHSTPSMFVEHTISGPGIHTFTAVAKPEQMVERLAKFWQLHSEGTHQESRVVSTSFMQSILEQVLFESGKGAPSTGIDTGIDTGADAGADTWVDTESAFAGSVLSINTVALVDHTASDDAPHQIPLASNLQPSSAIPGMTSTSFVQCQDALWQTVRRDDAHIELRPIATAAAGQQIGEWLFMRLEERKN